MKTVKIAASSPCAGCVHLEAVKHAHRFYAETRYCCLPQQHGYFTPKRSGTCPNRKTYDEITLKKGSINPWVGDC